MPTLENKSPKTGLRRAGYTPPIIGIMQHHIDTLTPPSRQEALAQGLNTYLGAMCKYGHHGMRYIGNNACITCCQLKGKAHKQANAAQERERKKKWKQENRERYLAHKKAHAERHKAAIAATNKAYRERDPLGTYAHARMVAAFDAAIREHEREEASRCKYDAHVHAYRKHLERIRYREVQAARTPHQVALDRQQQRLQYRKDIARDPERMRMIWRNSRAKRRALKNAPSSMTNAELREVFEAQGGRCAYCGDDRNLHLDHMTPISRGGRHVQGNVQFLCATHNMDKRTMTDPEYRRFVGIPCCTPWDVI